MNCSKKGEQIQKVYDRTSRRRIRGKVSCGLNFGWVGTLEKNDTHDEYDTKMDESGDTRQTYPIIRIIKTLRRHAHGVVVP